MRVVYALFALGLLVLLTGNAWSSGDVSAGPAIGGNTRSGDYSYGFGGSDSTPACGCPDLAYTDLFKSRGLGYVNSPEFADAILAVADGKSTYSPQEIPGAWLTAAKEWKAFVAAHRGGEGVPLDPSAAMSFRAKLDPEPFLHKDACVPALLYLASLEYRSRQKNRDVTPAFPHLVRAAIFDLGTQIVAKSRNTTTYAKRAVAVMAKISEAERLGAGHCEPSDLARAKDALSRARRDAAGVRASAEETDASFAGAERLADALLTKRQFAMARGFKCYQ